MSSSGVLGTLYAVTAVKNDELAKQRDGWKKIQKRLLESVEQEPDGCEKVRLLLNDTSAGSQDKGKRDARHSRRRSRGGGGDSGGGGGRGELARRGRERLQISNQHLELLKLGGISLPNVTQFLEQSSFDPSISPQLMKSWETSIRDALRIQGVKFDYATLFTQLVMERSGGNAEVATPNDTSTVSDSPVYEKIGRTEMYEQRKEWESYVFEPVNVDEAKVTSHLEKIFGSKESKRALEDLRDSMEEFGEALLKGKQFNAEVMKWCVRGLLKADLLSDSQADTLKGIAENPAYVSELCDVLNIRLSSIETWSWGVDSLPLEMRRKLNGKYRIYMQEEITQALLLHFVGTRFAVRLREAMYDFHRTAAWAKQAVMKRTDKERRQYFLGTEGGEGRGMEDALREKYDKEYFLSQLSATVEDGGGGYGEDNLADGADQKKLQPFAVKQSLLHLLKTELLMNDRLDKNIAVFQTDFKWFGPSLSHSAVFAALKFFGVDQPWLGFFKKFLEAPLKFIHDGPNGPVRTRVRGVPMSHAISDMLGEVVLFCLDFEINQKTNGAMLFRLHDDIFFYGEDTECVDAWNALTNFAATTGLELNLQKTGATRIPKYQDGKLGALEPVPKGLPTGPIKWGLLVLDTQGNFIIDQSQVDTHIIEFRRQLDATKSIIAWTQAYNVYTQFLLGGFCKPADCFGRAHVDDCLQTLKRVHLALFPSTNGNVAGALKSMIATKFQVTDIPDGFLYFPMLLGGLELRNPFVLLQLLRHNVIRDPMARITEALDEAEALYHRAKARFERGEVGSWTYYTPRPTEFMSWREYQLGARERSQPLLRAWEELLEPAVEENVEATEDVKALLKKLPDEGLQGIVQDWHGMQPYWKVLVGLHAQEMRERFGGLAVVDRALLPMGIVSLFRSQTVRWEG